jgi:hypothetical protein
MTGASLPIEKKRILQWEGWALAILFGFGLILWPFLSFSAIVMFDSPIHSRPRSESVNFSGFGDGCDFIMIDRRIDKIMDDVLMPLIAENNAFRIQSDLPPFAYFAANFRSLSSLSL